MLRPNLSPLADEALETRQRWRLLKDSLARWGVGAGGIGVIIAILLIFFYLLYVVYPLFLPAQMEQVSEYALPGGDQPSLFMGTEELGETGVRYTADGNAVFFETRTGALIDRQALTDREVSAFTVGDPVSGLVGVGLADGGVVVARHKFEISYPNNQRTITPMVEFPYGEEPLEIAEQAEPITKLALRDTEDALVIASVNGAGRVQLTTFTKETSFLSDEVTLERSAAFLDDTGLAADFLLMEPGQDRFYIAARDGELAHYDISDPEAPRLMERVRLLENGVQLTSLRFLIGGYSLLAGDDEGRVGQWFPVRDRNNGYMLQKIRSFDEQDSPIESLAVEQRRKGFLAADRDGRIGVYHSTAERTLLVEQVSGASLRNIAISPRADFLLAEDVEGRMRLWHLENEHPEVSWSSLWGKVHYEGYTESRYIWQSSSASNDFEPKFSLVPLSFGTLKAAFYAMLIAVPLAIMGAIYTAYFMAPGMRKMVKPTIEIMEALPTVILGFLAGLWLAPFLEKYLPGVFALLVLMPIGMLAFAYLWHRLPRQVRGLVPDGWEPLLLIPVVLLIGWGALSLSIPLEHLLFDGDIRTWLRNELGVTFDQRNAIVVGLAMGFAVIPTIFSITEDAIFSVPKHLTFGSLALGATPWQTLTRVVILTASPGIFSAVMIGLGRAVGETMIVLMATGNTPVMDFSMFQGMRTLSANIAVEMPESEVGSTHYRILFLAALVLFMFTFAFNTVAEVVRQRLRRKYSSL